MKVALIIGKDKSTGIPGKNWRPILGRPMVEYPLMAAYHCDDIDKIYVSTDSPTIIDIAYKYNVNIINRPPELALPSSPTEDVFEHAWNIIKNEAGDNKKVNGVCLMFANSPDTLPTYLKSALDKLEDNDEFDSVISISKYNMFTPLRARKIIGKYSEPVLDLDKLGIENTFDRDAMGDIYYADFGVQAVKPYRCLEDARSGSLPYRWLGKKQGYIIKDYGFDIDYEWQFAVIEKWLTDHGFSETNTPY